MVPTQVKQILASVDGEGEIDAIIEAVPYLLEPQVRYGSTSVVVRDCMQQRQWGCV